MLPDDPIVLFSVVNTRLRDRYETLDALCEGEDISREQLEEALATVGYRYDAAKNQFA